MLAVLVAASGVPSSSLFAQAAAEVIDFGQATLREWVQPAYPDGPKQEQLEGWVYAEFVVEADGSVSEVVARQSSDARFDEAALAAIRQWRFHPDLEDGKPRASTLSVRVGFRLAQLREKQAPRWPEHQPQPLTVRPPQPLTNLDPWYPLELGERHLPGEVLIRFTVDANGQAHDLSVVNASHPAFVESALRALDGATFEPARQGRLPRKMEMEYPVEFARPDVATADILAANRIDVLVGAPHLPRPLRFAQPVYPLDKLLAEETGSATAEFTVTEEGRVGEITFPTGNGSVFEAALQAAMETWLFKPAFADDGRPSSVRLRVTHEFSVALPAAEKRLAMLLRPGGAGVGGAAGLDRRLNPLWRVAPLYPASLREEKPQGEASLEFVIDREGRVRMPRVLTASHDAFGHAAAVAVSQWVFERPLRGGESVDVRVRLPITFQ